MSKSIKNVNNLKNFQKICHICLTMKYNKIRLKLCYKATRQKFRMEGGIKMKKKQRVLLNTLTSIRLKPETLDKLERLAEIKQRKTSELMRMVLENYVEQFDGEMLDK